VIERKNIETFAASLHGGSWSQVSPDYDEGRVLWNGMMDKRPALIARCEGVADVNFAHPNNIILGVRGGGHNVAGLGAADARPVADEVRSRGASQNSAAIERRRL
jgi:FAD/FMN-containing dehydrogenase